MLKRSEIQHDYIWMRERLYRWIYRLKIEEAINNIPISIETKNG